MASANTRLVLGQRIRSKNETRDLLHKTWSFIDVNNQIFSIYVVIWWSLQIFGIWPKNPTFKMGRPRPLFRLFSSYQHTHYKFYNKCPCSILCWDSNSWPLEHESPSITTRPGLPQQNMFPFRCTILVKIRVKYWYLTTHCTRFESHCFLPQQALITYYR